LPKTLTPDRPILAAEETDVISYLAPALTAIALSAACGSLPPTAPSATPLTQPPGSGPAPTATPLTQPPGSGPVPIASTSIVSGSLVHSTVERNDPVCFPIWDSGGHCRQFDLTASSDATLRVTLRWEGPSRGVYDPELFLVSLNGSWVYAEDPWPERHLDFHGRAGQTYRILVIGYQPPQPFDLVVEVQ